MLGSPEMPASARPVQNAPLDRSNSIRRDIARWTPRRKLEVLIAIDSGLLSLDDVCRRYELGLREIAEWKAAVQRGGITGLQLGRLQHGRYRQRKERKR